MQIVAVCKNLCFSRYVMFCSPLCSSCAKSKRTSSPKPTSLHFFFWGLLTMHWILFIFPFLPHNATGSFLVPLIIATLHPNFTLRTVCLLSLPFNLLFFSSCVLHLQNHHENTVLWLKKREKKANGWEWSCILKTLRCCCWCCVWF